MKPTTKDCGNCGAGWITASEACPSCGAVLRAVPVPEAYQGTDGMICATPWVSNPHTDFATTMNEGAEG